MAAGATGEVHALGHHVRQPHPAASTWRGAGEPGASQGPVKHSAHASGSSGGGRCAFMSSMARTPPPSGLSAATMTPTTSGIPPTAHAATSGPVGVW
jgi:hypothetical protein